MCSVKGYRLRIVSSDAFAAEKIRTMRAFGADVELIPSPQGIHPDLIPSMMRRAAEVVAETGGYPTDQFNNRDMLDGYAALGTEIADQLDDRVDAFVGYIGTAGCFLGTTRALRARVPGVRRVGVEPAESPVLAGGEPGTHRIEGGGAGFWPPQLTGDDLDAIEAVSTDDAMAMARRAAREEGLWSGPSTGANLVAALRVARELGEGRRVVDGARRQRPQVPGRVAVRVNPLALAVEHPRSAAVFGALAIAMSGVFYLMSGVSPSTGVFWRCVYGLPILLIVAWREWGTLGPMSRRAVGLCTAAGLCFAVDLITFHYAVDVIGAGLATVMGNLQVVIVALAAWAVFGERPRNEVLAALPVMMLGVVLISGVVGAGAYGANPQLGVAIGVLTATAYAGYLLIIRRATPDQRPAAPVAIATAVTALCAGLFGAAVGDLDLTPGLPCRRLPDRPRGALAVGRLPGDPGVAAAPARGDRLGPAARPARDHRVPRRVPAARAAVAVPAGRRRPGDRRDRARDRVAVARALGDRVEDDARLTGVTGRRAGLSRADRCPRRPTPRRARPRVAAGPRRAAGPRAASRRRG